LIGIVVDISDNLRVAASIPFVIWIVLVALIAVGMAWDTLRG